MIQLSNKSVEAGVDYCLLNCSILLERKTTSNEKLFMFYTNYLNISTVTEILYLPKGFQVENILRVFRYRLPAELKNYETEKEYRQEYAPQV